MKTPELTFSNKIRATAALFCASIALAGCTVSGGEQDPVKDRQQHSDTASDRYSFDYGGDVKSAIATYKIGCLDNGPYESDNVVVKLGSSDGKGTITVTPEYTDLGELHFTGFYNYQEPLQPADQYTAQVLDGAGCITDKTNHADYI